MKNDQYKIARGGWSRMLEINCGQCTALVSFYQKDGPGPLKRLYLLDRMIDHSSPGDTLTCEQCKEILGTKIIYQKEKRPAYRLFVGSVTKKVVRANMYKSKRI